jgi:hypothetical protein
LVALGALVLVSSVPAGSQTESSATGLFVFSRGSAPPREAVVVSTASAAQFSRNDKVHLFLVPRAASRDVKSPSDERITSIGTLQLDNRGRGALRIKVPDIVPGTYVIGRWCLRCRTRSYRRFKVLQPTGAIPPSVRSRMSFRVEDVRRCNNVYSESLLNRFFAAFNSGNLDATEFFASEDRWIWWRDPNNMQDPLPYGHLGSYLRTLQENGVILKLASFSFTGYRPSPRLGEFGFRLDRGDRPAGNGKGAVDCTSGLLALVTIDNW